MKSPVKKPNSMSITIKKINGEVIFSGDFESIKKCVEAAVKSGAYLSGAYLSGADLRDAYLRGADLSGADLSGAYLRGAYLSGADLRGAYLSGADLSGADLRGAYLRGAYLSGADLRGADLRGAYLRGAYLSGAYLSGADLSGADLRGADLSPIKSDFLAEVLRLPNELEFLRDALIGGRVNGSTYNDGECGCLAGTMAYAKGIHDYTGGNINNGLTFHSDGSSPRETFFLAIKKGDTPDKNPACQIALEWTNEAIAIRDNIRATIIPTATLALPPAAAKE